MEKLEALLRTAVGMGCSDMFVIPGSPVMAKVGSELKPISSAIAKPVDSNELVEQMYTIANRERTMLDENGDDDFSFSIRDLSRFRVNVYRQRGSLAITCRAVMFGLPDPEKLSIPKEVMSLAEYRNGMILVTGPAGSGKSTTLACLVDKINATRYGHIVSIEDPIEFLHSHKKSLVSQREVPTDAPTFAHALRASLRQAPDVILLGEMRDTETIHTAITAAETGHLLLSSLHTVGSAKTIDRVIDSFPAEQQAQVRLQMSLVLRAVVSQRLLPTLSGKLVAVFEVMTVNPAISNLIRDGRTHQIDNVIAAGASQGMISMDNELMKLVKMRVIDRAVAINSAVNPESLSKRI